MTERLIKCGRCQADKPEFEYYPQRHVNRGVQSYCKHCQKLYVVRRGAAVPTPHRPDAGQEPA